MLKLPLNNFDLNESHISELNSRTWVIKKWNWDYEKAHAFQKAAVDLLQEQPNKRILICCNHPRVLTHGRGLQKPRKGEVLTLIEFKPELYPHLPFPLHQIERGGGLTFHHPGQFIFYPIVKLNPKTLSLSKMIDDIFDFSAEILNEWGIQNLDHKNKLLGLWHGEQKIASTGIAIEKLITYHGMALNIFQDTEMKNALRILNPCGLTAETYTSAEELHKLPENALEDFTARFLRKIAANWT